MSCIQKTQSPILSGIPTEPNGGNHTPAFSKAAASQEAHEAMLNVVKALTFASVRALDDDKFYAEVSPKVLK